MTPTLARRILALPPAVRAALDKAPGAGWYVWDSGRAPTLLERNLGHGMAGAWWPANPADAVCAVCDVLPHAAHQLIADACPGLDEGDDDHEAALGLIEAHLRSRP